MEGNKFKSSRDGISLANFNVFEWFECYYWMQALFLSRLDQTLNMDIMLVLYDLRYKIKDNEM